ncbi:sushi, von Willebrand factor type A, EGF and pentraxin domain-containing protein 1-like isoform X2 [Odontomachus brunneus]|uniref:sushi, von Willebrand factor type A, EGF and pentraxin domain-containing protein 1-like isoform X2 n=1 Tax=Odontomachus brunneus TaxID=486640 RepID=UPI0013F23847|nr:sushi, von Willebrand factor type A, EGF and pentraxin domain-containing protein 1-like isoform X2 [Odontomachus brunneus]
MGFFIKILLPTIGTLLLFVRFTKCETDVVAEGTSGSLKIGANRSNVTSTFYNIDRKKNGDQGYWYEHLDDVDTMLKSKTDILSRRLKIDIDRLRNKTDQIELVFLVDASGSVGVQNFRSELNFVTKLLSDFTVDATAARVAIITFGSPKNVTRNVDQISRHGKNDHKCYLLNKQFNEIAYSGGGTYTRGALLEALAILEKGREVANKVVFLITDGFSNGGDPRPAANLLKNAGATVFTFGIRTGNVEELHDIASFPGYTHSYLLDSFAEFEALARRALHRDLKTGQYVPVTLPTDCNSLCAESMANQTCCDDRAICTCGTATGHYACICPSGYFGSGLRGACQPCLNGTYASESAYGDSTSVCIPCPDVNHITVKVPAISVKDCMCASGFTTDGLKCEAIMCPKLRVPDNGYLVKASACSNVVHAACGIRCRIGFHLTGDSIRLCGKNGSWSGNEPQCLLKTCSAIRPPVHGHMKCEHDENYQLQFKEDSTVYPIDTRCQFKCDVGYQLRGSKVRNCLPLSRWDGLKVTCKAVKCEPLPKLENGDIIPEICSGTAKVSFATNCTISCRKGFILIGPSSRLCGGHTGIWSQRHSVNRCVDKVPPSIKCPSDIVTQTEKGQNYAYVNWSVPEVTDNGNEPPIVWTKPHITFPWKARIGTRIVVYIAQDAGGNKARCKFKIKVLDREPPTIENCNDPPTFYTDIDEGLKNVIWEEPVFYDNSKTSVQVNQSHRSGEGVFPIGQTRIFYSATDKYGNLANCVLNITVEDVCESMRAPVNGRLNCSSTDDHETQCVVACNDGYGFAIEPMNFNSVNDELLLKCNLANHTWENNDLPECSGRIINENFENPKRGVQKLREKISAMMQLGKLDLLNNRTNQEIAKLALNLHLVFKEPQHLCDLGSVLKKYGCVKCSAGTFYNSTTKVCQPCPFGQYQNVTASLKCRSCPEHTFTKRMHAKFSKDCIPVCRAGYYSRRKRYQGSGMAMEPCVTCDIGFYQPNYGQTQCFSCPLNTTTEKRGSTDIGHCSPLYHKEIDDCRVDLCLNGGRCLQSESDFVCACEEYYVGSKCEKFRNPCDSSPCLNEGVCKMQKQYNNSITYNCTCKNSYTGVNCEIYIDECSTNPCRNGGKCVSTENDFACICKDGFEDQFCEIPMDHCELMPCEEGSTCHTINGTWKCFCKPGFLGRHCNLLPCDWLPCHENAICVNIKEANATRRSYRCECPEGYTGENCTTKIDHCESSPCLNNGKCISHVHNYICECSVPFTGRNCETELSSDYAMHFTKSGTMDYVIMKGPTKDLFQLSVCLWLHSIDSFNYGTVLSYATMSHDNAFTLTDYNGFVLYVNAEKIVTDIKVNDGYWHFLCVTWESESGSWRVFIDGILKDSGVNLARGTVIRANGSLVIGQEQDRLGGGFSESEAFLGKLSLLDIWDTVLDENNIMTLWNSCEQYHGNLLAWAYVRQYIHGDVLILPSPFCRGCPLPVVPFKGNFNVSEDLSEVTYYCDNGYMIRFSGKEYKSFRRKCLKHGQWEGYDTPICTKIKCGFPGNFPRGYIQGRSYLFEDKIYYFCANGYELRGNPHRICNSDGKWIGMPPICIGTTCKNLLAPENGDIDYILEENERDDITILQAGQQLEFKCNPGYRLLGEKYLTCLETGIWDHDRPSCISYGCPSPKRIEHGYISFPNSDKSNNGTYVYDPEGNTIDDLSGRTYYYGDIVSFSCHEGYRFHGNNNSLTEFKIQCSDNGTWTDFVPDCIARVCPWPDFVKDAEIFLKERDNITMIKIPIKNNATSGNGYLDENNEDTAVRRVSAEMFVSGAEIIIICDPGYELIGDEIRTCTEEGSWSSSFASCEPRNCSFEDHPIFKFFRKLRENEIVFGNNTNAVPFEFDEKWNGVGSVTGAYKNFEIFVEGNGYRQRIVLVCRDNTQMNFNEIIANVTTSNVTWTCNENAKWEVLNLLLQQYVFSEQLLNDSFICDKSCALPQIPEHGYIDSDNSNNTDTNDRKAMDSVIIFKCRHGYILQGNAESICLSNGTWSALPFCKAVVCGEPPILANAILKKDINTTQNYTFGNMVSYQCVPGYRIFGQANLRCLGSGKWSRMNGRCSKISCGKPQIQYGIVLYGRSYLFQDQLTYMCPDNEKQHIITCQADGKWSGLFKCDGSKSM